LEGVHGKSLAVHQDLNHGQPHGLQQKNHKFACSKRITVYQLYRLQHKKYKGLQQKNRTTTPPREQGVHHINNTPT
jgi:hypothetical protein